MNKKNWALGFEFKPEDFWIGAYWRRDGNCFDIWICLLPMFPIHFSCWGEGWGMPSLDPDDNKVPKSCTWWKFR